MTANVLFDVGHPAHVHLFRNAIAQLEDEGHDTRVLSREKELTTTLLDRYGIEHTPLSTKGSGDLSLLTEWLKREFRTVRAARAYGPDVVVGVPSPPAAHAAALVGCPMIVFDDSELARLQARLTYPFADRICTPAHFDRDVGDKQDRYAGYHELAYLHPNRFDPDPDRLRDAGVDPREPYSVLRFVSWSANHDVGQHGLSADAKRELLSILSDRGDVYVTSEEPLPPAFEPYRLRAPPELIHDLLYYADLYVGDSQTMATEAAILGTPAVRSNSFAGSGDMSNFVELEETYGLLYSRSAEAETLRLVRELLPGSDVTDGWERKRERLLEDKIDVTEYMVDVIYEAAGVQDAAIERQPGVEV